MIAQFLNEQNNIVNQQNDIVRDYHPTVRHTTKTVDELVAGNAVFTGAGMWRGPTKSGLLPTVFPELSVMLFRHNYDSMSGNNKSVEDCVEVERQLSSDHFRLRKDLERRLYELARKL